MSDNVLEFMLQHVETSPQSEVLRWTAAGESPVQGQNKTPLKHHAITWKALMARVEKTSRGLAERGFSKGDKALLFVPMSVDLYVAMFAVFRLGGTAVFLDAFARQTQLENCAKLAGPRAFFGSPEAHFLRNFLPDTLGSIAIQVVAGGLSDGAITMEEIEAGDRPIPPMAQVDSQDTALVSFTTGSSGKPKGANRTHGFLRAQHKALATELPWQPGDTDMPAFPIFLLHNIACGITTTIPAINFTQPSPTDAPMALRQLLHSGIDTASMSPALLTQVAKEAIASGHTLGIRRMITGGAPIGHEQVRLFSQAAPKCELLLLYGSTEAEPIAHLTGKEMLDWLDSESGFAEEKGVCVGHISTQVDLQLIRIAHDPVILGDTGWKDWLVHQGDPGEIIVAGEHVSVDYYQNEQAFHENKIRENTRIWHRTGDVGRIDSAGRLWLIGRVHNAIRRAGKLLFPVEPEQRMQGIQGIQNAAYVGLPCEEKTEQACVAWIAEPEANTQSVESAIRQVLGQKNLPLDQVIRVEKIPLDPRHNSKVDYAALRIQLLAPN
jgi:acyl-CoA synthetase (AMP-forming)/AMP-acid ligase II